MMPGMHHARENTGKDLLERSWYPASTKEINMITPCKSVPSAASTSTVRTTLYELLTSLQDAVSPDENDLVVATIAYWQRTGCMTWLGDAAEVNAIMREEGGPAKS
jgi:hypothetical protein